MARTKVKETRTALEQAQDPSAGSGAVASMVQTLLDAGIDGKGRFDSAASVADAALAKAGGNTDKAIGSLVSSHLRMAAASGFVTSLGGFVTMPISLPVNVLGFYLIATRLSAAIAHLRGYDITQPQIRTAVLLSLVGSDAQELLGKAGMVAPGGKLVSMATSRLQGPALMVVNKAVGFRILSTAGRQTFTRFGRAVPLVGGAVGAGLDGWLLKQLADTARREFPATGAGQAPAIQG